MNCIGLRPRAVKKNRGSSINRAGPMAARLKMVYFDLATSEVTEIRVTTWYRHSRNGPGSETYI